MNNFKLIICILFILGCNRPGEYNELDSFCEKEEVLKFSGFGVFHRGLDNRGNKVVYVSFNSRDSLVQNSGNVRFILKNDSVVSIDKADLKGEIDLALAEEIALLLQKLNVYGMSFSWDQKVYFFTKSIEYSSIVYSQTEMKETEWKKWKGNLYVKRGRQR